MYDFLRVILSNASYSNESRLRWLALRASTIHNARVFPGYAGKQWAKNLLQGRNVGSIYLQLAQFLGDKFDRYMDDKSTRELVQSDASLGPEPCGLLREALALPCRPGDNSRTFADTFREAISLNLIDEKSFYGLVNLYAHMTRQEAVLAQQLEDITDQVRRSEIRKQMAQINCEAVGVLEAVFAHMLSPHAELAGNADITQDKVRQLFPEQLLAGEIVQFSFSNAMCVNRILNEFRYGKTESDPVIAILESKGQYTQQFKQEVDRLARENLHRKTIPYSGLPAALQDAIAENQRAIDEKIASVKGRMHMRVHRWLALANQEVGVANYTAREAARTSPPSGQGRD
jgi:hypothetical protein